MNPYATVKKENRMEGPLGIEQIVRSLRLLVYGMVLLIGVSPYRAFASDFVKLRQQLNFNRDWRFVLGDPAGAEAPGCTPNRTSSRFICASRSIRSG